MKNGWGNFLTQTNFAIFAVISNAFAWGTTLNPKKRVFGQFPPSTPRTDIIIVTIIIVIMFLKSSSNLFFN